jgi:hypothetical protein
VCPWDYREEAIESNEGQADQKGLSRLPILQQIPMDALRSLENAIPLAVPATANGESKLQ